MSLKFGIYLVEQRIISPEQFCGLVKIQQEATMSLANIAIRKNFMTIKQVSQVLDLIEANPEKSFLSVALEMDLIDRADAEQMMQVQHAGSPTIQKLVVECGLLTKRQTAVLFSHFDRIGASGVPVKKAARTEKIIPAPEQIPMPSTSGSVLPPPKFQQHAAVRESTNS